MISDFAYDDDSRFDEHPQQGSLFGSEAPSENADENEAELVITPDKKKRKASLPSPGKPRQQDLFICDVADAILKDVMQQMEHPFYSLSKRPSLDVIRYENGRNYVEVTPSVKGRVTIYDKDLLIYAISQIMAKRNRGEEISPRVRIHSRQFLLFTNRGTGGREYKLLISALERIQGTTITTNIVTGDTEQTDIFGLVDSSAVKREFGLDGRLEYIEITLSDWLFNAINASEVLTLHRDYFRLSKPYERRLYEVARKHCGQQKEWRISVKNLKNKMGSQSPLKKFRFFLKGIAKSNHLPDYLVVLDLENDVVCLRSRKRWRKDPGERTDKPIFRSDNTYERAKQFVGRECVYAWEREWQEYWRESGSPPLKSPDAAFINFCKTRYVQRFGKSPDSPIKRNK